MTFVEKLLSVFVLLLIIGLLYMNWDKISKLGSKPVIDSYTDCVNKNAALPDGAPCGNCIPNGSTIPKYSGIISNGVCQQSASKGNQISFNKIKITNPQGAKIYQIKNGTFVLVQPTVLIATNTVLDVTQYISSGHYYYNTAKGWIDGDDASIITI